VVTPIATQSGGQTSIGTGFTIDNANFNGSLFLSGLNAFCGNQSDFAIFSGAIPDSGVKGFSDYLMKANGIHGGTAINLWGDSIMAGQFSTSGSSNFLALVQYYNPNTLVSDFGVGGLVSGNILGCMTNNGAAQPPTTGNVIDCWYAGVNDSTLGVPLATWEANTTNAMNYSHRLGHKFDIFEIASYAGETGNTITRAAMNSFIDGLAGQVDAIFPLGHDPIMGTNGASVQSGTIYFANSIHPNAAGYYQEYTVDVAPILQAQLSGNSTNYGPGNFTGTFSGTGSGESNIFQSSITAPYQPGQLYIEEEIPLTEFSTIIGNAPTSTGQTPTPYFTQPYLTAFTPPSTLGKYSLSIPQWVTNLVLRVQYQYSGGTNVFWTNTLNTSTILPVAGALGTFSTTTFTIKTNNFTYVFFTNSIQSTIGTNCLKQIQSFPGQFANVPTNIQNQISITAFHLWLNGYYDGSNW
jgi:hypothetical protein